MNGKFSKNPYKLKIIIHFMIVKSIFAKQVKDSRNKGTIRVILKTSLGKFVSSAPAGKSTGKYEVKSYAKSLDGDIEFINNIDIEKINKLDLKEFEDLEKIEKKVKRKIGGNSLFVLEACILKAMAKENGKELWQFLLKSHVLFEDNRGLRIRPVGNTIGGGLHSKGVRKMKPDFQEFLFIASGKTFKERVKINRTAYKLAKRLVKAKRRNDEGAWETGSSNEEVLEVMRRVRDRLKEKRMKVDIGLDIAASGFYKNREYVYKNPERNLSKPDQIADIKSLIKHYRIPYVEDPMDENDFPGFRSLNETKAMIVGDDLTTTDPDRLKKAIRTKAISGIIVKPNQIGSLLKVREVVELAKKYKIKTIISHRSGETMDNTIADLGVGFGCDFIKTGIYGRVRSVKLKRLIKIEKQL